MGPSSSPLRPLVCPHVSRTPHVTLVSCFLWLLMSMNEDYRKLLVFFNKVVVVFFFFTLPFENRKSVVFC